MAMEPWNIIEAFVNRRAKRDMAEEAAARNLEAAPIQQAMDIEKAEAMKRLGIQYLPQELAIQDRFKSVGDYRAADIAREARTHSGDEQIRANEHQLTRSNELGEGRETRREGREWGRKIQDEDRAEDRDNRKSAREQSEAISSARIGSDIRVEEQERLDPLKAKQDERLLKRQKEILDEKSADAKELQGMKGDQAASRQANAWAEKIKFHERFPNLGRGMRGGSVNMLEENVVGIKPDDLIALNDARKNTAEFEYLGKGQGPKGELVEKYRLKNPAPTGSMIPNPAKSSAPATSTTPPAAQGRPYMGDQNKSGVVPEGSSTPKSGDRIQKSSYEPVRRAEDAPPQLRALFEQVGDRYDIDPDVLASHTFTESGWNPKATSRVGAQGIAQFMPATAQTYGVDPSDVRSSVVGMAKYMNKMADMFDQNLGLTVAGYNWGEGSKGGTRGVMPWLQAGADPRRMPAETRNHVLRVTGRPIEHWVDQYFNRGKRADARPQVTPSGQKNDDGDDLFYVDIG